MMFNEFVVLLRQVVRTIEKTYGVPLRWTLSASPDRTVLEMRVGTRIRTHSFSDAALRSMSIYYVQGVMEEMVSDLLGERFEIVSVAAGDWRSPWEHDI